MSGAFGRKAEQLDRLIACAERAVAEYGLSGLRARDIAKCAGCSVGAIYNHVADLDELALRVAQRTMANLDVHLEAAALPAGATCEAQLVAWALSYRAFADAERNRWRALFDFRMQKPGAELPEWFAADQLRIFVRLEKQLAPLMPSLDESTLKLRARTLFGAVHGIVLLGLEQKLVALPMGAIDDELGGFVRTYLAGLRPTA